MGKVRLGEEYEDIQPPAWQTNIYFGAILLLLTVPIVIGFILGDLKYWFRPVLPGLAVILVIALIHILVRGIRLEIKNRKIRKRMKRKG